MKKIRNLRKLVGEEFHWAFSKGTPAKTVNSGNVDTFLELIAHTGVRDMVATSRPDNVVEHALGDFVATDLLYIKGNIHVRVFLETDGRSAIPGSLPIAAVIEIERVREGLRRRYVSKDTAAITRVMRSIRDRADVLALMNR